MFSFQLYCVNWSYASFSNSSRLKTAYFLQAHRFIQRQGYTTAWAYINLIFGYHNKNLHYFSMFVTDSPSVISTRVEQIEEISVLVRWETENRRILIARYDVELKDTTIEGDTESRKIYQTTSNQEVRQLKINNLKPGTLYGYRVRAVFRRNGGHGTWSKFQYFTTKLTGTRSGKHHLKNKSPLTWRWPPNTERFSFSSLLILRIRIRNILVCIIPLENRRTRRAKTSSRISMTRVIWACGVESCLKSSRSFIFNHFTFTYSNRSTKLTGWIKNRGDRINLSPIPMGSTHLQIQDPGVWNRIR